MSALRAGIVTFPGSNCDRDIHTVLRDFFDFKTDLLWHDRPIADERSYDLLVVPGGFSYGDYLRCGAIARFSPAMQSVVAHAQRGGAVLGICNGFQILCEARLLPGALIRNRGLLHLAKDVTLVAGNSPLFQNLKGQYRIPVSHSEGNFRADDETLKRLEGEGRVALRYLNNPNGSINDIAGILSENGRVLGMMPHPERATDPLNGKTDGRAILEAYLKTLAVAV